MRDIAAVMVTVDRTPSKNYLLETLENLERSDLGRSGRLKSLTVVDSGSEGWAQVVVDDPLIHVMGSDSGTRCANLNVAAALRWGAALEPSWVLFLEDDIDVCARFFDSVGAWLDQCATAARRVFVFGSVCTGPKPVMDITVDTFYGTQAIAMRRDDAENLAAYLDEHCYDRSKEGVMYDLLMHDWAAAEGLSQFAVAIPSFVQHIGRQSVIDPRENVHQFATWRGREWSFC